MNKIRNDHLVRPIILSVIAFFIFTSWTDPNLAYAAVSSSKSVTDAQQKPVTVMLDDQPVIWRTEAAFLHRGTTYVSLRETANDLGAEIAWNTKQRAIELHLNGDLIIHRPGTSTFTINEHTIIKAPAPSITVNQHTMVPLRTLAEVLKADIHIVRSTDQQQQINVTKDTSTIYTELVREADQLLLNHQYSGLALITQDGRPILRKGYGYSDNNKLVRPHMPSRIASLSKSFTAAAIMKLVENNALKLTDPLSSFIPDYPNGERITVHMLLSHTSGITSNFPRMKGMSLEDTIDAIKQKPLAFEPGTDFKYSNTGYMILGYIIEQVSGMSYGDYLSIHFFQPLSMRDTGEVADNTDTITIKGYVAKDGQWVIAGDYISRSGSGTIYSTLDDLLLWDQALQSEGILTADSLSQLYTSYSHKNYGYGWMIDQERTVPVIFHNGSGTGYSTSISRSLGNGITIILLGNQSGRNTLIFTEEIRTLIESEFEG